MKTEEELNKLEDEAYDEYIRLQQYGEQYLAAPDRSMFSFEEWLLYHYNIRFND